MQKLKLINSIVREYGIEWLVNRLLYSAKLTMLKALTPAEVFFEHKTEYPKRINLFQINTKEIKQFLLSLNNQDQRKLIKTADNCVKGIIRGFSSVDLDYGSPIDWQLNPLTHKRCDKTKKWFQIPDFDKECGDIKVTWEASRFSYFITLARAFLLTGNEVYYIAFSHHLDSWLKENQYGYGANFKCGQECALRMVNALFAFTVFKGEGVATVKDADNIKELIDRCYHKILSNFFYAYKCIKNNHTISELMGMIVGAWCCKDENQLKKAFNMLDEVIDEQFTSDGGYRQFSFNYQRLALQDLECLLSLETSLGFKLSEKSRQKIKSAALLMYQCQDETGDMPNYGSNDGALIFPLTSCDYRDFRPTINAVYALISGKQLYKSGKYQEELLWLVGNKNISDYKKEIVTRNSMQFKDAGLFTLRDKTSWAMIVLNDYKSRPGHLDQLHIDIWMDGVNVLCDGGTYSYASELGKKLVQNESHNTLSVKDKSQMSTYGPFMVYDWSEREMGRCDNNSFEGVMKSKNGYTQIRRVEKKETSLVIIDTVNCEKDYQLLFHTPCMVLCEKNECVLSQNGKQLCKIKSNGLMQVGKSKRSLYYLKEENVNCIAISKGSNYINIQTEIIINH